MWRRNDVCMINAMFHVADESIYGNNDTQNRFVHTGKEEFSESVVSIVSLFSGNSELSA